MVWAARFRDTFRYLNQFGLLARNGVSVSMHNTLAGSDYGLIKARRDLSVQQQRTIRASSPKPESPAIGNRPNIRKGASPSCNPARPRRTVSPPCRPGGRLDSGGGSFAFVLNASGSRAHRRTVKVGRRNPEMAEILSGLQPGANASSLPTRPAIKGDALNIR